MTFTLRWFGPEDPVDLAHVRQVPGIGGIVTALHEVPAGEVWSRDRIAERGRSLAEHGFDWAVAESIPVHESIKLGDADRDLYIERYAQSIRHLGEAGITTLCYNFMPVFDWIRTEFTRPLPDGSNAMSYVHADLAKFDLSRGMARLAAWAQGYTGDELARLLRRYEGFDGDALFERLAYFLRRIVPVAEEAGVRLALHPDDPPWPIFGLPRIVSTAANLRRILAVDASPHHGLTFCTGALGAARDNDLVAMAEAFGARVNFLHARNVRHTDDRDFYEAAHPTFAGDVDMFGVLRALVEAGFDGPVRPDHGRMIWGESGIPGYGLHDRALGVAYLQGLDEALRRHRAPPMSV